MSWSSDDDPTVLPAPGAPPRGTGDDGPRLRAGQALGPYRVDRLLGRGGMGEVYEAEHIEHGRRLALKVLNQRLAGADDRARFLREGQLAASLNHPNSVYVFGSEVIDGNPLISMELVTGGTLKDAVERDGPMAPAAAVDAMLQVVAGLDAALACGFLHRDVKPSNCFVDPDGSVKVGDFGLSIPVLASDLTQPGETATFQGTPQFAAPEQLRGQALDVRADIYAVGATLYYLLTGRPPFDDRELMTLLTKVAADAPVPPGKHRAAVPPGLSALVLRCLAKDPASRPSSYAELDAALRPFSSAVPAPANLGLRGVAGAIDWLVLAAVMAPFTVAPVLQLVGDDTINAGITQTGARALKGPLWVTLAAGALTVLYFGLCEGRWGRSLGKQVCGLAVTTASGEPAGPRRAALRALIFATPYWIALVAKLVAMWAGIGSGPGGDGWVRAAFEWAGDAALVLLFSSVRRRNGLAAWHELATGTRVTVVGQRKRHAVLELAEETPLPAAGLERRAVGPYVVTKDLGERAGGSLMLGVDPALKRQVWVHVLPTGTPALGASRARLGRIGRLRWLNGRRTEAEAWDAYEAPDGHSFLQACARPQPWHAVQHWLADLAGELEAADFDGSMPALALDRVWIARNGQARLLDFPAPGLGANIPAAAAAAYADPQRFLARVVTWALYGGESPEPLAALPHGPLPRQARIMLDTLNRGGCASPGAVTERAAALLRGADHVTRARRAASILLANVPLLFALLGLAIGLPTAIRLLQGDFLTMSKTLVALRSLEGKSDPRSVRARAALERFAADRFRDDLAEERTWSDPRSAGLLGPLRATAARVLAQPLAVSDEERRAAHAMAQAEIGNPVSIRTQALAIATALPAVVLLVSAIAGVLSAFLFRGGLLLRLLGLAVVSPDGADLSRVRAARRAVVAWSPVLLLWGYLGASSLGGRDLVDAIRWWQLAAVSAIGVVGCVWAVRHPARGPAERLTGTYLIPR